MIPTQFRRLVGALVLALAPSLASAQVGIQQPAIAGNRDTLPAALAKLYQNDLYLQSLIGTRFGQLGGAAFLNVGTLAGTVAEGGALTAETARAQAAEQANATAIATKAPIASPTFTGIPRAPTAAAGATGTQLATLDFVGSAVAAAGGGAQYAVTFVAQSLTAPQQLQARQNIAGAASGANTDISSLNAPALGAATATTASAGTNTTQVATTAFSTTALMNYAGTVSATYAPLASPTFTGAPKAPTAALGDNSTTLATTAYVDRVASGAVRSDAAQAFTSTQQGQARSNIYAASLEGVRTGWIYQARSLGAPLPLFDAAADDFQNAAGIDGANSVNATVSAGTVINQANDNALVGLLHFDEGSGTTTTDVKGHGVTLSGAASISSARSKFGASSLLLNGTNAYATLAASTDFDFSTGDWSVEGWGYSAVATSAASQTLFGVPGGSAPSLTVYNGAIQLSISGTSYFSGGSVPNSAFFHWALVKSGSTITGYLNGASIGSTSTNPFPSSAQAVTLGALAGTNFFNGNLDEVRIRRGATYIGSTYTVPTAAFVTGTSGNLDLRSVAWTAQAVPTKGSIFLLVKALGGTLTPNTNFTVSMRRDSGAAWVNGTLASVGVIGGYTVLEANDIDLTGGAANTNVQYRAQTSDAGLSVALKSAVVGWR